MSLFMIFVTCQEHNRFAQFMIQNSENWLRVYQQTMESNKDYALYFSRDAPQGYYPQHANQQPFATSSNSEHHNTFDNLQTSIVSGSLPLSGSPTAELSTEIQKAIGLGFMNPLTEPSHYPYPNKEPIYEAKQCCYRERPQQQEQINKPYLVHEPINNYPSSQGMPRSQDEGHKLNTSQATAVTHGDIEGHQSDIFDQPLPLISQPERYDMTLQHNQNTAEKKQQQNTGEHQKQPNFNNQADIMSLLTDYVFTPKAQIQRPQETDVTQDMLKLLGRFSQQPQTISQSQTGYLLNDSFIQQLIGKSLTNYYSSHEKPANQPFYENQTVINAEDERFIFKLSFKYENENLIFNWECKKIYPREEYGQRKYECMNYFVVDVFPTYIILFNDFTVQPFVYSKGLGKNCIRTQLRTFISLKDLSKTVTIKYSPSEADTTSIGEHSKYHI